MHGRGHVLERPAIKKLMGQRGMVKKKERGRRAVGERVRGAVAAEEASVFPHEWLWRAKWTWKSRERGRQCWKVWGAAAGPRVPLSACCLLAAITLF